MLPKIGIDTNEFTDPNGTGRINFYQASSAGAGATISGATPKDTALFGDLNQMKKYDLIIPRLRGWRVRQVGLLQQPVELHRGRWAYHTSHFGYAYPARSEAGAPPALNTAWDATATWKVAQATRPIRPRPSTRALKGVTFASWLQLVAGGMNGKGQVNTVLQRLRRGDPAVAALDLRHGRWHRGRTRDSAALHVQHAGRRCDGQAVWSRDVQRLPRQHRRQLQERQHLPGHLPPGALASR